MLQTYGYQTNFQKFKTGNSLKMETKFMPKGGKNG